MTYEVVDTSGQVVWTGSAKDATAAMTKFRKESGVGFPNKAVFDGNYGVRKVRKNPRLGNMVYPKVTLEVGDPVRLSHQGRKDWGAGAPSTAGTVVSTNYFGGDVLVNYGGGRETLTPSRWLRKVKANPVRKNHWLLPMAVGAGALYGAQKIGLVHAPKGRKNPDVWPNRGPYDVVKFGHATNVDRVLSTHATLGAAQAAHKAIVLKGDKLIPNYIDYGIVDHEHGHRAGAKANPGTRASRADAAHKLFGGPRHKVTKRFLKGENVGWNGLAVKIVKYGKDYTTIIGSGVPQQAVPTAQIEDISSPEWNKRWDKQFWGPEGKKLNPSGSSRGPWKSMAEVRAANAVQGGHFFKNKPRRGSEMQREGTIKGPYNGRYIVVPQEVKLSSGWTKKGVIYRVNDDGQIRHVDTLSGAFAWENAIAAAKEMSG